MHMHADSDHENDGRDRRRAASRAPQAGRTARGEGFLPVIREALELYIRQHRAKKEVVAKALELEGSFSDDEVDALEASVRKLREDWR
jgi:hypothetical protein